MYWNARSVTFDAEQHRYTCDGRPLASVTGVVRAFGEQFDREGNASRVATRRGISVEDVYAEWRAKRELGDAVHVAARELAEAGVAPPPLDGYGDALRRFWADVRPDPLGAEQVIAWPERGVAGTVDLIARDGGIVTLWDYKTSADVYIDERVKRKRMREPLQHLVDDTHTEYCLQLSMYRRICDTYQGSPRIHRCMIVQLRPNGSYRLMPVIYLADEVEDMLAVYPTLNGSE